MEESQDLPDRIVDFEMVKVNRGRQKFCQCYEKRFEVDTQNRVITCRTCGAWIDPFDAMVYLAGHHEQSRWQAELLLEQRKQIINYKPHLVVIRNLEQQYRGKRMLPTCPHCKRAFYLEELTLWTNRDMEDRRREKARQETQKT